jgi:hypothetical protein
VMTPSCWAAEGNMAMQARGASGTLPVVCLDGGDVAYSRSLGAQHLLTMLSDVLKTKN